PGGPGGPPPGPQAPGGPPPGGGFQPQAPGQPGGFAPPGQMSPSLPNAPGAVAALILGIISVVTCGVPTGPFAIWQGFKAEKAVKKQPWADGGGGWGAPAWIAGV